ncbi:hypothetical protein [Fibrobacter sp.]|uniref:hypothetical protein n=1 Tax=Fibrobacter sp. TaxID=35828 RepID=UPI0026128F96|nr:hypothetical protein [Fibrobacter sp.]MDD5942032.1 hypothetical protein [Fibrobacter sp.]
MYIIPKYETSEFDGEVIDCSRIYKSLYGNEEDIFEEEFVVDNIACTTKLKTLADSNKRLYKFLAKDTRAKETYIIHFRGKWKELAWTIKTICNAGLTFNRNVEFYRHNKTRLLAIDFDGNGEYGLMSQFATLVYGLNDRSWVLAIPSASCNYKPGSIDEKAIKKYHVFAYTEPYDCIPKEIARISDEFSCSIALTCIEVARQIVPWDKAAMSPWLRFFSKSVMTVDEIEKDTTINVRYRNETDVIFEYRNFEQMFKQDFLRLDKCTNYVPNRDRNPCKNPVPYSVPPFGEKESKKNTDFRNFFKELKEFAGLTIPGVYPVPHYDIGRLDKIVIGERNSMATRIIWAITFNIYSIERFCGKGMENEKAFALEWFNAIFNATNVDEYEEFMGTFNPGIEYDRKRDDSHLLERYYENPDYINERHFHRTVRVGYGGAYQENTCSSREELESVAKDIGMSRATMYRKAKWLGLPEKQHKPHKSKLDQYINLTIDELNELVKSGKLNRMAKHRILQKRANVS